MTADIHSGNESTDASRQFPDGPWTGFDSFDVDEAFDVLASASRRAVLGYLATADGADVGTLVDHVAATVATDRKVATLTLEHVHLPRLYAAGYVRYDHPWVEYAAPRELDALRRAVEARSAAGDVSEDVLDLICGLLAHSLRRGALTALETHGTLDVCELATHVALAHPELSDDEVALRLHHVHLPRLADAGAVEYDPGTTLVAPVLPE